MNKRFFVKYTANGDDEYELEYPTREEAEQAIIDLKDQGYFVDDKIDEERI